MGGIVMGLLIQTMAIARGMLQRTQITNKTHGIIWNGMGRKQQKIPMSTANETEWRLKCQIGRAHV
jgi:hypothetical protein